MKKHFTKFIFLLVMIIGLSISTMAQKPDKKRGKKPSRPKAPKIIPSPRKTPKPKKNKRPPGFAQYIASQKVENMS